MTIIQYKKYKVGSPEFIEEAKKLGITPYEYRIKLVREGILANPTDIRHEWARKKGYKDFNEYLRRYRENVCITGSSKINKDCNTYFGVEIAERYVSMVFEEVKRMPPGNPGYDWLCKKGYKIQHKARCLDGDNRFNFPIRFNNIADYFILTAWKDRESLEPMYIWIIHRDEIIRKRKFWRREGFAITNTPYHLQEFEKFEVKDKLEKLKVLCKNL